MDMLGEDIDEELEKIITEADKDGDGEIDLEEFINMMRARKRVELLAKEKHDKGSCKAIFKAKDSTN